MKGPLRHDMLLYGAFLTVSIVSTILFVFLEHTLAYRIIAILFLALAIWESTRLTAVTYLRHYTLFLIACSGFLLFPHIPLVLFTLGLAIMSTAVIWLASIIDKESLRRKEVIAQGILFTLLLILMADIVPHSLFTKAAICMLGAAGLAEIFKYRSMERWRVAASYGILTLLMIVLIITTAILR